MKKMSIRNRLLILSAIPMVIIIGFGLNRILADFKIKSNLEITKSHINEAQALSNAIHLLQIERGLSVGFVASSGVKNSDKLPTARKKTDEAIATATEVYALSLDGKEALKALDGLKEQRLSIDALAIEPPKVGAYFTKTILALVDNFTAISSSVDNIEIRNIIQSYSHLAIAKESLGQMRANLNGAFAKNSFADDTYFKFGNSFGVYTVNSRKFITTAPEEIKTFYDRTYKGDAVDKTFAHIEIARELGMRGGFDKDPAVWSSEVTSSINLLREVELELFTYINTKIETTETHINSDIAWIFSLFSISLVLFIVNEAVKASDRTVGDFEKTGLDIEKIVNQVSQINTISAQNSGSMNEIAQAAQHLSSMTETLHGKLDIFRT